MGVSERDRAFVARVAGDKVASHAEAQAQLPLDERLRRSWELYLAGRGAVEAPEQDDDPSPFHARARALGLCP